MKLKPNTHILLKTYDSVLPTLAPALFACALADAATADDTDAADAADAALALLAELTAATTAVAGASVLPV